MALTVVKVGGSLAAEPENLRVLMQKLSELSKKFPLVIIPGGGEFADTVRLVDKRFNLSRGASHRMAILAMDTYGLLLADLVPEGVTVRELEEAKRAANSAKLPIFLPSTLMFFEDPLENSWAVTSDSIALYIAQRLQANKVFLVTDVDGIYQSDPKHKKDADLIDKISPVDLMRLNVRTSVDAALPKLLQKWPIDCYVVNGLFPQRIEATLAGQKTLSTLITGIKL